MLEAGQITAGDVIKSFDFTGNHEYYLIGRVISNSRGVIKAKTLKVVRGNESNPNWVQEQPTFSTPDIGEGVFTIDRTSKWERLCVIKGELEN